MEKETTGLYISAHPLDEFHAEIEALGITAAQLNEHDEAGGQRCTTVTMCELAV